MSKITRLILIIFLLLCVILSVIYRTPAFNAIHLISLATISLIWIYVCVDIFRNKIYNKHFWILSIIILMPVATLVYLIQREHLIHLGEKYGTKGYHTSNFDKNGKN